MGLQNAKLISLAVDDSTDTTDITHLMVFVRNYVESKRSLGSDEKCGFEY